MRNILCQCNIIIDRNVYLEYIFFFVIILLNRNMKISFYLVYLKTFLDRSIVRFLSKCTINSISFYPSIYFGNNVL